MHAEEYSETNLEAKISLFLDNQLTGEEKSSFLQAVESNPTINQWVENEKKFREILKMQFERPGVTDDFAEKVKEKIGVL